MNTYLRSQWLHHDPEDPILIYMELDESRYALRWLEIFEDGLCQIASVDIPNTVVPDKAIATTDTLNDGVDFSTDEISAAEFESKWAEALAH